MKAIIFTLLMSSAVWAKPVVLISYYDAFSNARFNNSQKIAEALALKLNTPESAVEIKLCALNTIFDKAYGQLEECFKNLREKPVLTLSLGETSCELKVETIMRNKDRTITGPDNAGVSRNGTSIIPEGPEALGLRYPLPQMYCALTKEERSKVKVSNNAGSFVCNNTAYLMSYHYPEIQYGFIHVPSNNCYPLTKLNEDTVHKISKMIPRAVTFLLQEDEAPGLPHEQNEIRLETQKKELKQLRQVYQNDACLKEYLTRSKGVDERSLFGL